MKINEVEYVRKDSIGDFQKELIEADEGSPIYPFVIGNRYYVEQVTKYFTGRLIGVSQKHSETILILDNCAWIADTGRFSPAMASGNFNEIEPFPDGPVFISFGANVFVKPWTLILPRVMK